MSTELRRALEQVARRYRQVRLWNALAACWLTWAILGGLLALTAPRAVEELLIRPGVQFAIVLLIAASAVFCARIAVRSARDPRWLARRIEARHPDLTTALLAAVEQGPPEKGSRLGYLQMAVIGETLAHRRTHDWNATVPNWRLIGAKIAHAGALVLLFAVAFILAGQVREQQATRRALAAAAAGLDVRVEPGDTEIERGTSLLVVARFDANVPAEATLVADDGTDAGSVLRRSMTRSLKDPAFAGRVASVERDLTYHVEFGGRQSKTFRAKVFDYPEVLRTDAALDFPSYTALEPKTVEDIRHVTAVEGTNVTLRFRLNKPVAAARLVDQQGKITTLAASASDDLLHTASFVLSESNRLKVELVDGDGRMNKSTTEIALQVVRNKAPVVAVSRPAHDVRVSPLEELLLQAKFEDDFGVTRHGVSFALAGQEPHEIVLDDATEKRFEAGHLLDFESLAAEPDQLVTYYFWAEDVGPGGEPRRSLGDMFFAEVRPFEEIFRQGEQPPASSQQGQSGNAQQAMQLAELQKEIINGTWRVIRRETGSNVTEKFADDAKLLIEAQQSAIEQATQLAEKLSDPQSQEHMATATGLMQEAVDRLTGSLESASAAPLDAALVAEQAAYQALLKLRDREFSVSRSQQQPGGGGGSAGGPSQRQLEQLELSNDENRYEQRSTANAEQQSAEEQQQREMRQIMSRLRELAQRQDDLNERIKDIQAALEAAEDEQAREEIERRLKRLREQQQQILRDTDELRERLEREENRDRLEEAREQVEQSRERVRQASEALQEGRLSQALTEGTRAQRELDELREDLRRESANQFSESMTEMRDRARQLDENQDRLSEQLEKMDSEPGRSLREDDDRREVRSDLEEQRERLDELLEQMRGTVQEAEETEPLLAEPLYETVRETERRSIPEALDAAQQLTDLGVASEAAKASRHAGEGIDDLREGVERAAESILGDETAALRLARSQLEQLTEQLDREIAQATGQNDGQSTDQNAGRPAPDDNEPGEPGSTADPAGEQPQDEQTQEQQQLSNQTGQQSPTDSQQTPASRGEPSEQNGRSPSIQPGEQPTEQPGEQPGEGRSGEGQPSEGQTGQGQTGQPQGSETESQQPGRSEARDGQRQPSSLRDGSSPVGTTRAGNRADGLDQLLDGFGPAAPGGPIIGDRYREWSDRLRDVEELLEDPEMRAEAARVRDRARGAREEYKRHSREPDWNKLRDLVANPLHELQDRVLEELRRRESPESLVPIDRDPVPPAFAEGVRRYYERLGSGQ